MNNDLQQLRENINTIDRSIIELLAKRFGIAKQIGEIKKQSGMSIEDRDREQRLFEFYRKLGDEFGVDQVFLKKLFEDIIEESKRLQI
jgi:chorismate mutase